MRLGVLPVLAAAAPLFLVACSGDDTSDDNNQFEVKVFDDAGQYQVGLPE